MTPKSPVVRTRPVPKISCQSRLTATRAVKGFSGRTSHGRQAEPVSRKVGRHRRQHVGSIRFDRVAALVVFAAEEQVGHRRLGALVHHVGDRASRSDRGFFLFETGQLFTQLLGSRVDLAAPPGEDRILICLGTFVGRAS